MQTVGALETIELIHFIKWKNEGQVVTAPSYPALETWVKT